MTLVAILPIRTEAGAQTYQAVARGHTAAGNTAGQALDALTAQLPESESETMLIVQQFRPDGHFSASQQRRMAELMARWRAARDAGASLSAEEQLELESLVNAELQGSGERAGEVAKGLGK